MPRKANVITICLNQSAHGPSSTEINFMRALEFIDTFSEYKPDLICLPEVLLGSWAEDYKPSAELANKFFCALAEKASSLKTYIIAGVHDYFEGSLYNVAWLIDREGKLAGRYLKHHLTIGEMENRKLKPGKEIPVFETDFGTIGIMTCYDIGYPLTWRELALKGAELVVWIAAYDGGFPLQAYAGLNNYFVVSSSRGTHSKIIDKTGKVLSSSSRWCEWTSKTIDLEMSVFHIDHQYNKLPEIQKKLGNKIHIESYSEENIFTLESFDPEWPMEKIKKEFGLETCSEYFKRAEIVQDANR